MPQFQSHSQTDHIKAVVSLHQKQQIARMKSSVIREIMVTLFLDSTQLHPNVEWIGHIYNTSLTTFVYEPICRLHHHFGHMRTIRLNLAAISRVANIDSPGEPPQHKIKGVFWRLRYVGTALNKERDALTPHNQF